MATPEQRRQNVENNARQDRADRRDRMNPQPQEGGMDWNQFLMDWVNGNAGQPFGAQAPNNGTYSAAYVGNPYSGVGQQGMLASSLGAANLMSPMMGGYQQQIQNMNNAWQRYADNQAAYKIATAPSKAKVMIAKMFEPAINKMFGSFSGGGGGLSGFRTDYGAGVGSGAGGPVVQAIDQMRYPKQPMARGGR